MQQTESWMKLFLKLLSIHRKDQKVSKVMQQATTLPFHDKILLVASHSLAIVRTIQILLKLG